MRRGTTTPIRLPRSSVGMGPFLRPPPLAPAPILHHPPRRTRHPITGRAHRRAEEPPNPWSETTFVSPISGHPVFAITGLPLRDGRCATRYESGDR
jgi:hypothetical protein